MNFKRTYDVDLLGISNTKYILNHIEDYLLTRNFIITHKSETLLKYQYKYLYIFNSILSLASRAQAGNILINYEKGFLKVKLHYTNYFVLFFSALISGILYFGLYIDNGHKYFLYPILLFVFFYGLNSLVRYFAQKRVFRYINQIIMNLSD